jgi:hypothetical protein
MQRGTTGHRNKYFTWITWCSYLTAGPICFLNFKYYLLKFASKKTPGAVN